MGIKKYFLFVMAKYSKNSFITFLLVLCLVISGQLALKQILSREAIDQLVKK